MGKADTWLDFPRCSSGRYTVNSSGSCYSRVGVHGARATWQSLGAWEGLAHPTVFLGRKGCFPGLLHTWEHLLFLLPAVLSLRVFFPPASTRPSLRISHKVRVVQFK